MIIPKYIQDIMSRSKYEFDFYKTSKDYAVGYTIRILKYSEYQKVDTFNNEIDKLQTWVNRQIGGECIVLERPTKTRYCKQYAIVTIFDPVMKHIEKYIPNKN